MLSVVGYTISVLFPLTSSLFPSSHESMLTFFSCFLHFKTIFKLLILVFFYFKNLAHFSLKGKSTHTKITKNHLEVIYSKIHVLASYHILMTFFLINNIFEKFPSKNVLLYVWLCGSYQCRHLRDPQKIYTCSNKNTFILFGWTLVL